LTRRMNYRSHEDILIENELLRSKLAEATDTLDAIRTGQIDALVVNGQEGHSLYTLKSADHTYRVFVEQMAEGALSLNSDGLIIYSNSQFARILNRPLSNIVGRRFSEFVASDDQMQFKGLFNKGWEENVKSEIAMDTGSSYVPVQVSLNALKLEGENALSVIVTDLTLQKKIERQLKNKNEELKTLNEALLSSNHDLQQFASVASHDLQEPLRKIQVFSKFLKDRNYSELSSSSKHYVEKIITCAQRMKVLIIDILTYSKLSAGDENLEAVNLNTILQEILEDFDLRISEKNAKVELALLCTVEGNKGQLRQVFHNLVSNALKFAPVDRMPVLSIQQKELNANELGLSLDNDANYCRITVTDNGIGFDERYSSSIFSLFEKLNPKTTYEGSGIGLAIAKKIIDKHHGIIFAKSAIGRGSEFNVILPFKQPSSK
jgi:PAS domain S-box-containing protein